MPRGGRRAVHRGAGRGRRLQPPVDPRPHDQRPAGHAGTGSPAGRPAPHRVRQGEGDQGGRTPAGRPAHGHARVRGPGGGRVSLSVLLAEDHPVVREGLRAMLEAEGDFQVVGQTGNSSEVGGMVEELHPDVLVLDLIMPGIGGLNALRELARRRLSTRVVVLSMYANEAYVLEALQNGAGAYVLKQSEAAELVRGIREVAKGRRYLSPPLSQRAVEAYAKRAKGKTPDEEADLTAREREVLNLVGQGFTSAQIAERLFISVRTVESHRSNLTKKLGLHSQAEMVRCALRRELAPLNPSEA